MNLNLKTQRLIYVLLLALIFLNIPLYFLFVQPEITAEAKGRARIDEARLELRKRMATINTLKAIESKMGDSHNSYDEFTRNYLFSKNKVSSELLRELDQICVQAGLVRNRVSFSRPNSEPQFGMQKISFTLPIEGSYANIRKFLNILESRPRFIIVDSITLESEREGTGLIRMDMNLSVLFGAQS